MATSQMSAVIQHLRRVLRDGAGLTDGQLLEDYISRRDEAAFAALVRRHGPMVWGVCCRVLRNRHDAEDAFQATFLVLVRRGASIASRKLLANWLYGVAHRTALKARATVAKRKGRERQVTDMPEPTVTHQDQWRDLQPLLDEELSRLPDKYRGVIVLCDLEGKTRKEVAVQLGCPEGTVASRLVRARTMLAKRLTRRGVALTGGALAVLAQQAVSAAVPNSVVDSTIKAASLFAAGKTAATGAISVKVVALAEGVNKAILFSKFKIATALLLAVGLFASGIGMFLQLDAAPQQGRPTTEKEVLDADKTRREPTPRLDADGRPLPDGAIRRLGSRRFRVEGRSDFILPTPDGQYVLVHPQPGLSSSSAQGLMLVDAGTGLRVRVFEDSRRVPKVGVVDAIRPAVFSPDGAKLYALARHKSEKDGEGFAQWASFDYPSKRVLLVWDVPTGKLEAEWDLPHSGGPGESLIGVNMSPDGKRLYVYGAVRMRATPGQPPRGVAGLHVLDALTGKKMQTWEKAGYPAGTIAGGKEVITFRRGAAITAHDAQTGKEVRTFPVRGTVPDVAVSPDGKTVAAVVVPEEKADPTAGEIKLWEAATGGEVLRIALAPKTVRYSSARVIFAADGKTLYLAGAGRILRWSLPNGHALPDWPAHVGSVADLFFRPGKNELVSSGEKDGALRRWDAATGKALSTTDAYVGEVAVARTPDGKEIAVIDGAGRLDVWDVTTGRITKTVQTPGRNSHELLFTRDGKLLLVAAETGPNTIWDWSAGKQVGEFSPAPKQDPKRDEDCWGTLCFSPDGNRLLASKFGRGTWMWAWPERKILWHEVKEQSELECSDFLNNDTLVGADWHNAIEFRDLETGIVNRSLPGGAAHIAFSHDRRRMVTAHLDAGWRVRDGMNGGVLKEVKGSQYFWCSAFSPSGWLLAVAGDNSVWVYDTATWQEVARFDGHEGTVRTVFFGPDDATLISASPEDGTALVWSLKPSAGGGPPDPGKLWAGLTGDGPAIRQAVWAAAHHPDVAISLFRKKWPVPRSPIKVEQLRKLISDLDSEQFSRREAAQAELLKLGRQVEGELRKTLRHTTSLEVKRRVRMILDRWSPPAAAEYSTEDARELRAVWALELAGTPEAKELLAEWAKGGVGNRLCEEAAAALKRLQHKQ